MATATEELFSNSAGVTVTVEFDDVTGGISGLSWVVPTGTMHATIQRVGQPDVSIVKTSNGSQTVPANRYFLVQDRGGAWSWRQTSYSIGWNP